MLVLTPASPAGASPAPRPPAGQLTVGQLTVGQLTAGQLAAGQLAAGLTAGQRPVAGPVTVTLLTGDRVTLPSADAGAGAVQPGPGRDHIRFLAKRERNDLYVVPSDAQGLLGAGKVDRRLFNVTGLIRAGYHDAARDDLPLIVDYANGAARRTAGTLDAAGARVTRELPAIGGAAVRADKDRATELWTAVTAGSAAARTATAGGVDRIWLDGKRRLTLEQSVPQIGAPAAHAAGYTGKGVIVAVLDTGIDTSHPDLAGKVADSRNFSEEPDPADTIGHGTHVASIIAGSGAASGGKYRGVAPDATLLSGKVCESNWCTESAMLDGLHWAAAEKRATVVNFSIGGMDGPEIDPLEEAVNTLTAQTGTLFVISAGNDGADFSVSSPGSAEAALTVGAVDRDDELADFSSRGPRVGDDGIKPDITAPGVDIVAARAAGTELGDPVGEHYVAASGTSMSAPHVTGAVALLAQQHADWTAGQFKATLMASARPNPALSAYEQGAGRVDVARAVRQTVTSDPVSLSFGRTLWPHADDEPVTRTVTYRNPGTAPLTLDLVVQVAGPEQAAAPAGMFATSADQVTVPAGGEASVSVTVDTSTESPDGYWSGRLVATGGDTTVVTPLAVHKEVESYNLTVRHLDGDGAAPSGYYTEALDLADGTFADLYAESGERTVRLPKGRYGITSYIDTPRGEEEFDTALLAQPALELAADRTVSLDARQARPVTVTVPEPTARNVLAEVSHTFFISGSQHSYSLLGDGFEHLHSAHIGESRPADEFVSAVGSQWVKRRADGDPVAYSPYLYSTRQVFPGRLPTGFTKHYRSGDLAVVDQRFRGTLRPGEEAERGVFGYHVSGDSGWAVVLPTTVPGRRTEYYSTGSGLSWQGDLAIGIREEESGWLNTQSYLFAEPAAYQRGRQYQESWNQAPYGPSLPTHRQPASGLARQGDTLLFDVPLHGDAAGHAGYSQVERGRTALYREGTLVGEEDEAGWGLFEVPPEPARYRLQTSATRSNHDLTSRISATWTFRSGHVAGEEWERLPAMAIRFTPKLTGDGAASAGRAFDIPVTVQRQAGGATAKVKSLTVEVSYDDGRTWQAASLTQAGGGADRSQWVARVRHPAGAGYVSLRAKATDSRGGTVNQTVIHAYRLK